jgi:hypothetical protein
MNVTGLTVMLIFNLWLTVIMLVITFNSMGKYNIGGIPNKTIYKFYTLIGWLVLYFIWAWMLGFINVDFTINR